MSQNESNQYFTQSYGLADHLKACCASNPDYEVLSAALKTDIEGFSDMLDSVALSYGHYSKHDASHSRAIVRCIEQLLGKEQILKLSPTDTWMILEVAYGHDIGMALTEEEIRHIWESDGFRKYLMAQYDSPNREIAKLAQIFYDASGNQFRQIDQISETIRRDEGENCFVPLTIGRKIRDLVADYVRRSHAERSGAKLKSSRWQYEDTFSGIQNRLYKLCGDCVVAHGLDRMEIITGNLPEITNGFSADYAHPRFVAMLLRLGDLFDIDNNRFNKYIIAAYGKMSSTSTAHRNKHRCITHLYISPTEVEIKADLSRLLNEADSSNQTRQLIDAYTETQNWFSYISDELEFWHSHGHKFIPSGFFYPVPILKIRDVIINGKSYGKENIQEQFKISYDRAFQIFGSRSFYSEPLSFVRELVQNAFDAVKFRILYDNLDQLQELFRTSNNISGKALIKMYSDSLLELSKAKVRIAVVLDIDPVKQTRRIRIGIADNGEGISRAVYKRMQSVGELGKRRFDRALIPGWMKPTGEFGIGLHSAFAFTGRINYRSFCCSTVLERTQIELTKDGGGSTVILPPETWTIPVRREPGTDVWIDIEKEQLAESLSDSSSFNLSDEALLGKLITGIKKVLAPNVCPLHIYTYQFNEPVTDAKLMDYMANGADNSRHIVIPDIFNDTDISSFQESSDRFHVVGTKQNVVTIVMCNKEDVFNGNRYNLCLKIDLNNANEELRISHKGSWLNSGRKYPELQEIIRGLHAEVHILGRSAKRTVAPSRDYLRPEAVRELCNDVSEALKELLLFISWKRHQEGTSILDDINNSFVLQALAKQYRALLLSTTGNPDDERVKDAIDIIQSKIAGQQAEGLHFLVIASDQVCEMSLTTEFIKSCDIFCGDPTEKFWLRTKGIFHRPDGLNPTIINAGFDRDCVLYEDIWATMRVNMRVGEFYLIRTGSYLPVNTLIVKYCSGIDTNPAITNTSSFMLLLECWTDQVCVEEPLQFIPAIRFEDAPINRFLPLAVRKCDVLSEKQWKHFHSFIQMPIPQYSLSFEKEIDAKPITKVDFSNILERCPKYIQSLVDSTYANQIEAGKYTKEEIKQSYQALIEQLAMISTR